MVEPFASAVPSEGAAMAAYEVLLHLIKYPSGVVAPEASVQVKGILAVVVVPQVKEVGKFVGSDLSVVKVWFVP